MKPQNKYWFKLKSRLKYSLLFSIMLLSMSSLGQNINFYFENAQNTNDGTNDFYEVDIMIETTDASSFKLGSGQLYFNYSTAAFGTNVNANNKIEVTYPNAGGYVCGQNIDAFAIPIYTSFVINDNTTSRVSWAFSQNFAACTFAADNITSTAKKLCHLKLQYLDVNENPMVCIESLPVFTDQFFTACGPFTGGPFDTKNCTTTSGTQLINDAYDCSNYSPYVACGTITTIWDGLVWSNGLPDNTKAITFTGDFTLSSNLEACSVTVSNNANIIVSSGNTFIITGTLNVENGSTFTIENEAALRQINNDVNLGDIIVIRNSAPMIRLDYTAWSSPVSNQQLLSFSPNTVSSRFYEYLYTGTTTPTAYQMVVSTNNFEIGKGYMIRVDNTWSSVTPTSYVGQFIGVPTNGDVTQNVGLGYNLIGNPYPSPINADTFLIDNPSVGSLYFWTHTVPASGGSYPQNNFASYTTLGGTAAAAGGSVPDAYILLGQGFYVQETVGGTVSFNNLQRENASVGTQFFRNSNATIEPIEKNRFWLNLSDSNYNYNQILIGYMTGASNNFDNLIDGKVLDASNTMLYNIIDNQEFVIQGRALPFTNNDTVLLGLKTLTAGEYFISIENLDGLFNTQDIFIKDKQENSIHNLKLSPYNFTTQAGTFNNRFEIIYNESQLSTNLFDANSIVIYQNTNNVISVKSTLDFIKEVTIYDITGRLLFVSNNINENEFQVQNNFGDQLLLVDVSLVNGNNKKIKLAK